MRKLVLPKVQALDTIITDNFFMFYYTILIAIGDKNYLQKIIIIVSETTRLPFPSHFSYVISFTPRDQSCQVGILIGI